ncbi:MAG TPA: RES family NAD+ phosphorylase [Myxococcota bacterium]|nr:RES family NAD+ phosphorylase [Myxococcota bacterium]
MPRAFRLLKRKHAAHSFDGEGARLFGGRWNRPGVAVVYASENLSLAALELLVHLEWGALLGHYVVCRVEFPESAVEELPAKGLPAHWRVSPAPPALQEIGTGWARARRSAVLRVPSAVIPLESNFLLNPDHPSFRRFVRTAPERFDFDPRLRSRG